ncbi:MAG: hypothetical protein VKN33_01850 [Candidatus Sericytochromatia bacterium]|nr:hypothetical protein [Candidatus Sericytochromatia bacterium]
MPLSVAPAPRVLATRPPVTVQGRAMPPAPEPELQCRDGHYLIDDWYQAQKRIRAAEEEGRKARQVAGTLTFIGGISATAGTLTMVLSPPLLPFGLVGALVGTGLMLASGALRLASASKVASIRRRAAATYQKAERNCRGRRWF